MEQGNGQRNASGGFQQIVQREQGLHRSLKPAQLAMIAIGGAIGTASTCSTPATPSC